MARIIYITDQGWQTIELQPHQGVGRHPNNAIQLLDTIVSKEHCVIEQNGQSTVLRDLGSMNGTYVNGERVVGSRVLRLGDEIRLGNTALQFDDGSAPFHFVPPPPSPGVIHHPFVANFDPATGAPITGGTPQWMVKKRTAEAIEVPAHDHLVSVDNSKHAIGQQVAAQSKEFPPFDEAARDNAALRLDYERLRITWELLREIGLAGETDGEQIPGSDRIMIAGGRRSRWRRQADGRLRTRGGRTS